METFDQIRNLHDRVRNSMFRLLVDFEVLSQIGCTHITRIPLYHISENQKFFFFELQDEVKPHINTITRLLESKYLQLVCDPTGKFIFFVVQNEYKVLTEEEKEYFMPIPATNFIELFKAGKYFSFLDEIL